MMNLLGDQITHYRNIQKFNDNEFFFDYLKKDINSVYLTMLIDDI